MSWFKLIKKRKTYNTLLYNRPRCIETSHRAHIVQDCGTGSPPVDRFSQYFSVAALIITVVHPTRFKFIWSVGYYILLPGSSQYSV